MCSLSICSLAQPKYILISSDFDQGFQPEEYGDFTKGLSRISTRVVSTFLQIDEFASEITDAPVTEIVRLHPPFAPPDLKTHNLM